MRQIAIGDIHGCVKTFKKLLKKIDLGIDDELILLGDLIDRGPDSKGVLDKVLKLKDKGHKVIVIQGNHEEMMLSASIDYFTMNRWLNAGGRSFLHSFGVDEVSKIDPVYLKLLAQSINYHTTPEHIFVHAGLNFMIENPLEAVRDMRWIRDWEDEVDFKWLGNRIVVHGHSPRPKKQIKEMFEDISHYQTLNLDAGCVFFDRKGFGSLAAYDTEAKKLIFQKYKG